MFRPVKYLIFVAIAGASSSSQCSVGQEPGTNVVGYDQVRPVLRKRCVSCHNLDEARGDLNLSDLTSIQAGASSGPVIVPGKPNESLLYTVAAHLEEPSMPPNSPKIPGRELDVMRRWIEGMERTELVVKETESASVSPSESMNGTANKDGVAVRPLLRRTPIAALAVHPHKSLVAVSGNRQVVFGDTESGEWVSAVDFPHGEVTSLKFSNDGKILLVAGGVGGLSGTVVGFDVETGTQEFQLADEVDTILALDISPDGRTVALGGPSKVVRLYSVETGETLHTLKKHTDWVLTLAFSPDGLLLASGDRFGGTFVWNPVNAEVFLGLDGHPGPVHSLAWDTDCETLITGCHDGQIRTWNMHDGELLTRWDAGVGPVLTVSQASDHETAAGGRAAKVSGWSKSGDLSGAVGFDDQVDWVAFASGSKALITADATGVVSVIDVDSWQVVRRLALPVNTSAVDGLLARLQSMEHEYLASNAIANKRETILREDTTRENTGREDTGQNTLATQPSAPALHSLADAGESGERELLAVLGEIDAGNQLWSESVASTRRLSQEILRLRATTGALLEQLDIAERRIGELASGQETLLLQTQDSMLRLKKIVVPQVSAEQWKQRLQVQQQVLDKAKEMVAIAGKETLLGEKSNQLIEQLRIALEGELQESVDALNQNEP